MIKRFIQKFLGRTPGTQITLKHGQTITAHRVSKRDHRIDPHLLSKNAVKVTKTLQDAGYEAYIVGGAVRDLLLGIAPKDFDVATNATPDQVQKLFRRSRLIGRRFQIVHVTFYGGRGGHGSRDKTEIIEVSTFRALLEGEGNHIAESGRILRDNVWGSQAEDATRRDFTINAMYYDPDSQIVLDYHGGMKDIRARLLRMIGNPTQRYREDPVRMLRAVRFSAKTGFAIDTASLTPISKLAPLLHDVPEARLFDEILKLLMSGHAWACLTSLRDAGLHQGILPLLDAILEQNEEENFAKLALERTDQRIADGKPISPGFLFATLLWHSVSRIWRANIKSGQPTVAALQDAIDTALSAQRKTFAIQRRHESDMREIWGLQPRFEKRVGKMPYRLLESPRFRAGYDFLCLRCATGELPESLANWWEEFQYAEIPDKETLLESVKSEIDSKSAASGKSKRRRRRSPKKKEALGISDDGEQN
jgi:poly(A) polymerase